MCWLFCTVVTLAINNFRFVVGSITGNRGNVDKDYRWPSETTQPSRMAWRMMKFDTDPACILRPAPLRSSVNVVAAHAGRSSWAPRSEAQWEVRSCFRLYLISYIFVDCCRLGSFSDLHLTSIYLDLGTSLYRLLRYLTNFTNCACSLIYTCTGLFSPFTTTYDASL